MKLSIKLFIVLAAMVMNNSMAHAENYQKGNITVKNLWVKTPPKGAKVAGGYLSITNTGKKADRLISGTFSKARKLEIHEMSMKDNIMMMKALEKGLVIKPGQTVVLKPGALHLMLMGLSDTLVEGEKVKGELIFENAGGIQVEYVVHPGGKKSHGKHHH